MRKLLSIFHCDKKIILIGIISQFFPYEELVDSATSISSFDKLKIEIKKVQDQNGEGRRGGGEKLIFLHLPFVPPFISEDVRWKTGFYSFRIIPDAPAEFFSSSFN